MMKRSIWGFLVALTIAFPVVSVAADKPVSIVLVYGGFVDCSSWQAAFDILTDDGYEVLVVRAL
jgi:hypothetical protein